MAGHFLNELPAVDRAMQLKQVAVLELLELNEKLPCKWMKLEGAVEMSEITWLILKCDHSPYTIVG